MSSRSKSTAAVQEAVSTPQQPRALDGQDGQAHQQMHHSGWSNASMQFANSQAAQRSITSPALQRLRNDSGVSTHACQHQIQSTCAAAPYPATIPAPVQSLQTEPQQHAYHRATQVQQQNHSQIQQQYPQIQQELPQIQQQQPQSRQQYSLMQQHLQSVNQPIMRSTHAAPMQQQQEDIRQEQQQQHQQQQQQQGNPAQAHPAAAARLGDSGQMIHSARPPRDTAIEFVMEGGATATDALAAVDAVADSCATRGDPESWADAAILWLATENEQRAEREGLATAMAASLRQEEERAQEKLPLNQQPEAELRQHFSHSMLIDQLASTPFGEILFNVPLREHVVALLELERQYCRLWYPGHASQQHFHELGEELFRRAASAAAAASAGVKAAPSRGSADKRKLPPGNGASKRQKAANCASPQAAEAAEKPSCGQNAAPGGGTAESTTSPGASTWAADIGGKVQELLQATAAMPSAAGELPDFLQPYGHPEEALVLIDQD